MKVESRHITDIYPYPGNPRRNIQAVAAVARSIREFGWRQPIVVDSDGVIIAGHTRLLAARKLGFTEVPVHTATDLTPEQVRAYRLADNRLAELAEWDDDLLAQELAALELADVDLSILGLNDDDLARLLNRTQTESGDRAEAVPPVPSEPVSRSGSVYQLGDHRLMVGDSTDPEVLRRLVGDGHVDLLLTDPPYGVCYVGKTSDALTIQNDTIQGEQFLEFLTDAFRAADSVMRPGAAFYVWHADTEGFNFRTAVRNVGWGLRQCLVWAKNTMVMGRQDYHWQHEPCLYGWKSGAAHQFLADRKQTTLQRSKAGWQINPTGDGYAVTIAGETYLITGDNLRVRRVDTTLLEFERPTRSADHPTMKPVALFEYLILNSARRGEVILDPFAGSGTTVVACERTGRIARVCELDSRYADVVRRRWAEFVHGEGCDWQALTPELVEAAT